MGPKASLLYQSRWNKGSLRLSYPPPIRQSVAPMQLAEVFFNISATSNAISFKGVWQWIVPFRGNQPKIKSLLSGHKWPQSAVMTTLLHRGNMEHHLGVRRRVLGSLLQIKWSEISRHWFSYIFSEVFNFHCHWSDCHLRYHQSLRPLSLIGNLFKNENPIISRQIDRVIVLNTSLEAGKWTCRF